MNRARPWITGAAALGIAALGCGAVSAQNAAEPNPSAVPAGTGVPATVAEPSAATPGTVGNQRSGRVDRAATQRFINQAAEADLAEIAGAHYAIGHSQIPEVKAFAQKMIADHTMANDQLTMIAMRHGYGIPRAPSQEDEASLRRLEQTRGQRFNTDYSQAEQSDHREVISQFRRAAQDPGIEPQVRQFAQQTLPILQDHLHMANQLVAAARGTHKAG